MPITFHCPKCGKHIKAPDGSGGNHSKCPSCEQDVYIPIPMEELEDFALEPLDPEEERRREEMLEETSKVTSQLRHAAGTGTTGSGAAPSAALAGMIHRWALHMSAGELDQATDLRERILRQKEKAQLIVQQIMSDEIPPDALSQIPRPVLNAMLKQLLSDSE
jgi:phage FluMu protein Com